MAPGFPGVWRKSSGGAGDDYTRDSCELQRASGFPRCIGFSILTLDSSKERATFVELIHDDITESLYIVLGNRSSELKIYALC